MYEYKFIKESISTKNEEGNLEKLCTELALDGWRVIHIADTGEQNFGCAIRSATLEREVVKQVKEKKNGLRSTVSTNN